MLRIALPAGPKSGYSCLTSSAAGAPNISSQASVIMSNASSTSPLDFYTLVPAPTSLSISSVTVSSVELTAPAFNNDSSGSSGYYFYITDTASTTLESSDWQSGDNTWSSSVELTANTQYYAVLSYRNFAGVETVSTTQDFYTLANSPNTFSASADSNSQITVSWTGDGSEFYNGVTLIKNPKTSSNVTSTYLGNYVNGTNLDEKIDDGATYLKIIDTISMILE